MSVGLRLGQSTKTQVFPVTWMLAFRASKPLRCVRQVFDMLTLLLNRSTP